MVNDFVLDHLGTLSLVGAASQMSQIILELVEQFLCGPKSSQVSQGRRQA